LTKAWWQFKQHGKWESGPTATFTVLFAAINSPTRTL
jgi:hypothetical protein